jgi:hypothetical protein
MPLIVSTTFATQPIYNDARAEFAEMARNLTGIVFGNFLENFKHFFQDPKSTPSGRKVRDCETKREKIMPLIVATTLATQPVYKAAHALRPILNF